MSAWIFCNGCLTSYRAFVPAVAIAALGSAFLAPAQAATQPDTPLFFESPEAFCTYFKALKQDPGHPPSDPFATHQMKTGGAPYGKGDTYTVYVQTDRADAVDISEASRDSQLESDLKALVDKIIGVTPPAAPKAAGLVCGDHNTNELQPWTKVLKFNRSTLTLTATKRPTTADVSQAALAATTAANDQIEKAATQAADAAGNAAGAPAGPVEAAAVAKRKTEAADTTKKSLQPAANSAATAAANAAAKDSTVGTATVLIGPNEHWFLAVDLPVTNIKTLKYNSANGGSLQPTESSPQWYISLDYQLGDILEPPTGWVDYQRLTFKVLLNASSKPLDSIGVAVGYTFPKWGLAGADLSALSIFAGSFWTKQDAIVGGKPALDNSYSQSWRVGISYNFSSALSKVKF